jgi:hypothetical protein
MRTLRARPALLASLVIGVVAMMGLGFALWSETLNVAAAVGTGDLDMRFTAVSANEFADNATGDASCVGAGVTSDGNSATVTFTDTFPGYSCIVITTVRTIGTVDAVLASTNVTGDAALFDIERLLLADDPIHGGAADGQVYTNGTGSATARSGVWRVAFKTSNGNATEHQATRSTSWPTSRTPRRRHLRSPG